MATGSVAKQEGELPDHLLDENFKWRLNTMVNDLASEKELRG
jgi:hypothetical protein